MYPRYDDGIGGLREGAASEDDAPHLVFRILVSQNENLVR